MEGATRTDGRARFINGFVPASLIFCVGPLTFIGSIQDGMPGDYQLLAIKSVLDGFASLAFASAMGGGVAADVGPVGVGTGRRRGLQMTRLNKRDLENRGSHFRVRCPIPNVREIYHGFEWVRGT